MNKLILCFGFVLFGSGCAHPASTRAPDSVTANDGRALRCALNRGDTPVGRAQGPGYRPVYRVLAPNHYVTFLTVDHDGCAAAGFIGDETPEGYVPLAAADPVDGDPLAQCRVVDRRAAFRAIEPRTGFTTLTNDEVGCSLAGFVVEELEQ